MSFYKLLIAMVLAGVAGCDEALELNGLDEKLRSGEPFFSILYGPEFAKRFSLPVQEVKSLPGNIKAIAVEFNRINFKYTCKLHLYIDQELDVYVPNGENYFHDGEWSEYFFIQEINDADYAVNTRDILTNKMKIRFLSSPDAEYPFTETLSYARVHRSFLPGLSVLSFGTGCDMFDSNRYPADIWIQKQDAGDYLVGNDGLDTIKHPEKNHRFPIPLQLIDQIQPYIEIAERHNSER